MVMVGVEVGMVAEGLVVMARKVVVLQQEQVNVSDTELDRVRTVKTGIKNS